MEEVDEEFGPIRKSVHKVNSGNILEDLKLDGKLNKITLNQATKRPNFQVDDEVPLQSLQSSKRVKLEHHLDYDESGFSSFKSFLIQKLNFKVDPSDINIPEFLYPASIQIERVLKQCIIQKESYSAIITGPRSHFKKTLLHFHLNCLKKSHGEQFIVINLNGRIHSESAAINRIAFQLEYELGKRNIKGDYKLAKDDLKISYGTITEVFDNILKLLDSVSSQADTKKHEDRSEKITLIFLFDEIDQFAGPERQTLLYNLFDMVEHARIPVCVIGSTTKLNILEHLENRVKSRFSQRLIYMPLFSSFDQLRSSVETMLHINNNKLFVPDDWNSFVSETLNNDESELTKLLRTNYETFKNLALLRNSFIPTIALSKSYELLKQDITSCVRVKKYLKNQLADSLLARIESLSDLELAILICACRVSLKNEEAVNLTLVFDEYTKLTKASQTTFADTFKIWKKSDIKNIWETLATLDLIGERAAIGIRLNAGSAFQASYYKTNIKAPFDLQVYHVLVTLQEIRNVVPSGSFFYAWTQL